MEHKFTDANFEEEVLKSDKTVLVDFWATWCGPCQMMAPIIEELVADCPEVKIGKLNVDENPEMSIKYQVSVIPTIIIFKDGKIAERIIGYTRKEELLEKLK